MTCQVIISGIVNNVNICIKIVTFNSLLLFNTMLSNENGTIIFHLYKEIDGIILHILATLSLSAYLLVCDPTVKFLKLLPHLTCLVLPSVLNVLQ